MVNFSNVAKQQVTSENTAKYSYLDIEGMEGATLIVSPSTRSNKPYQAQIVKIMAPQQRRVASGRVNSEFINNFRETQKGLYAKFVVKGWEKILDVGGNVVPFNQDNCHDFLKALNNQSFDLLVEFCENEANFRNYDPEEVAKN